MPVVLRIDICQKLACEQNQTGLLCGAMPLVHVQKYVDFTDFTAHSRNFQIIYIFKSCKYSLRFVVQVCLDHAAHIYIEKVKHTESKHSASETISWSLLVVHVQGHSLVMPCTRQLLLLQPTNVHPILGYRNVLGQGSQTHSNTAVHDICPHAAMRA